jgi:glutamine synthetase
MNRLPSPRAELDAFLATRPDLRFVDVLLSDINAIDRGKRIDREGLARLWASGMPLPGSMYALDPLGHTVEATGLGFDDGDADRPCLPIPGTLVDVPWNAPEVAQVQVSMRTPAGAAFFAEPRHVLATVLERFAPLGLTPVVALEFEFYFIAPQRGADGLPQVPASPLTGRNDFRTQINSMTDLNEYSRVLVDIDAYCRAQRVPATSALAEYGPGQYEVNLAHAPDALRACDEAIRFRRIVKSAARRHHMEATFMAKPYREMAGSGLHLHVSLLDRDDRNVFACESVEENVALRHAIAGLVDTLADGVAVCAPNANSYRRFRREAYVPLCASWSINNRGSAVRIPMSDAANRRIEHRLAGADANPYLALAWVLAGILHGFAQRREPPPAVSGNAYRHNERPLPVHWASAIEKFAASAVAREFLGPEFVRLYSTVKRAELEDFSAHVTALECNWYLSAI